MCKSSFKRSIYAFITAAQVSMRIPLRRLCSITSSTRSGHRALRSWPPRRHAKLAHTTASAQPKTLFPPSEEQQVAIDTLLNTKNNIIIDACAGSGKTTTILHLAQSAPDTKFLVLVYNRRLMLETEERVQALSLDNVTVFNFHTLGARYYTAECATDQGLKRVVQNNMKVNPGLKLPDFSVLILDEQQDMTPILKRFVDKVIRDKGFAILYHEPTDENGELRVVVLGDRRQEIYGFNNADSRFLSMASHDGVFGYVNGNAWTVADQTTSNRVTRPNVEFINQQLLKLAPAAVMCAVKNRDKDGQPFCKPRYVVCDPYEDILPEVTRLLNEFHLLPADIIILAPSVRGASSAISLANDLALKEIPVFRSTSDASEISPTVARGKVLICSYHQAKGIERKAAIVLGFDQGYHTYFNKTLEVPTVVSNPQYVAATRALEHLILVHDYRREPLPFVDFEAVDQTCDYICTHPLEPEAPSSTKRMRTFNVSALCRNLSETLMTECLHHLRVISIAKPAYGVEPPPTEIADVHGCLEDVSSVTGTAVPAIYQWRSKRGLSVFRGPTRLLESPKRKTKRRNHLRELPQRHYDELSRIKDLYESRSLTTPDILYLSNFAMAAIDGDITKILALPLDKYNWLSEAFCQDIYYTLNTLPAPAKISGKGIFFEYIRYRKFPDITFGACPLSPHADSSFLVTGAMDVCRPEAGGKTVWEIKYTQTLAPEHLLQVALYMLLLGGDVDGFLVSARTGQTVQVVPRAEESLMEILRLLVSAKSGNDQTRLLNTYSDKEFLAECGRDFEGLVGRCALPAWYAAKPRGSKFASGNNGKRDKVV